MRCRQLKPLIDIVTVQSTGDLVHNHRPQSVPQLHPGITTSLVAARRKWCLPELLWSSEAYWRRASQKSCRPCVDYWAVKIQTVRKNSLISSKERLRGTLDDDDDDDDVSSPWALIGILPVPPLLNFVSLCTGFLALWL